MEIRYYVSPQGRTPFKEWLQALLLLCGSTKADQARAIKLAKAYLADWRNRA